MSEAVFLLAGYFLKAGDRTDVPDDGRLLKKICAGDVGPEARSVSAHDSFLPCLCPSEDAR